ncbi:MAG: sugar phosphate nucleotidyltransferase [Prevotella sp.]|jgi:MurNAc alpha-1-phosphate uridylyltransferase
MKQAMIFAAGLGTRLKPLTDTMPKALVKVGGEPLLQQVIMRLRDAGFTRIVVNVHHFAQQIVDYLRDNDNFGLDIRISDESAKLLDTGGGIKKAMSLFDKNSPILIHNVDILSNVNLAAFYEQGRDVDATLLVSNRKTKRYLLFDDASMLCGWTNIETGEVRSPYPDIDVSKLHAYAFSGIHLFSPYLFPCLEEMPDKFGIIDFYLKWCSTYSFKAMVKPDLKLMDVGKLDTLREAEKFVRELGGA